MLEKKSEVIMARCEDCGGRLTVGVYAWKCAECGDKRMTADLKMVE